MQKKINTKLAKLIKYYSLINHNLILNNKSLNRYNQKKLVSTGVNKELNNLRGKINAVKNCPLKDNAKKMVFSESFKKPAIERFAKRTFQKH